MDTYEEIMLAAANAVARMEGHIAHNESDSTQRICVEYNNVMLTVWYDLEK